MGHGNPGAEGGPPEDGNNSAGSVEITGTQMLIKGGKTYVAGVEDYYVRTGMWVVLARHQGTCILERATPPRRPDVFIERPRQGQECKYDHPKASLKLVHPNGWKVVIDNADIYDFPPMSPSSPDACTMDISGPRVAVERMGTVLIRQTKWRPEGPVKIFEESVTGSGLWYYTLTFGI